MHTICTDFTSKVRIFSKICNVFNNIKRENQPFNWLVFSSFSFEPRVGLEPTTFSLRMKIKNRINVLALGYCNVLKFVKSKNSQK